MSIAQNFPNLKPSLLLDFSNTEALDSRVTFARASTARAYDGRTVAKAEENLLIRSEEFDNAYWSRFQIGSIEANTGDTTAPDGTSTADKVTVTASVGSVFRVNGATAGVVSISCFVKAGTSTSFKLDGAISGNGRECVFDLSAGTAGSVVNVGAGTNVTGGTGSIQNIGDGWYRCVISNLTVVAANINLGFVVNSTGTMYFWGAQLEQRSAVTAYTPTTTQPITNYIPVLETAAAGVARFDHNPTTFESLGLLIEEQRTNLVLRSEEFDNASWTKTQGSIVANTIIAPDGTLTGDKFVESSGTINPAITQILTAGSSAAVTVTVYAKAAERNFLFLAPTGSDAVIFNLLTGASGVTIGSLDSFSITPVGNGWYRCSATKTTTLRDARFGPKETNAFGTYTGDGYSGIFIWGAQLEAGAFPTSYIPTVASQVTRSGDAASMTGANFSSWYRADEGSFYIDGNIQTTGINNYLIARDNATASNRLHLYIQNNTAFFQIRSGGSTEALITRVPSNKNAAGYELNNSAFVVNGQLATDTVCVMPSALAEMIIGSNGNIKKLAFYPKRLADAELQALTQN